MTHRYFVVGILVLGVIALLLPGPVSGQADFLVLSGDFHQASGWGCVGMPVAGAPGIITVTADQQTSGNLVVNANSLTANPDGSIWVIPTYYSVQNSGSSRPVNYAYSGMQIAMVGDIVYVFTQNSSTQLDLNSFIITGGSSPLTANWASPKTVTFSSPGTSMSLFKVIPSSNGIYLVSQQTTGNSPVLDISWIPGNQLENPGSTIIPSRVCQVANSSAFLAPATQIYNVMSTTYPGTNNTLIVGISDSGGQVYSWYVNPQNPADQAQNLLFSSSDLQNYFNSHLSTVALFKGSFETDPSGIDDLVVIAFMYDDSAWTPDTSGATFYANLTQLGTPGYRWTNAHIDYNDEMGKWYATPGLCCMYSSLAVPNGDGKLRSNMIMVDALTMTNMLGQVVTELTGGTLPSDLLVPDPGPAGTFDTLSSFEMYGNLAVPVGVIDGVPPIALNGHTLDPSDVDSKVTLIKTSTASTDTTGKTSTSVTSGYDDDFEDEMISVDASYEQTITQTTTTGTEFSNTMTEDFGLDSQGGNDYAYMVYLAPQFKTQRFYVYDYNGNPPVSGSPKTIYVTYPDPATPYKYFFQGYPITNPPETGWLAGAMKSPWYDDFDDWDQATWSGGWHNRDWTVTPDYNKKYQVQVFDEDLEFQNGASQTSTYDMTSTVTNSYETEKKISASANILGFERSGEISYEQDSSVSNTIEQGLEFYWSMSMPDGNESGYQTVVVEPQIVTPIENMGAGPWTPSTYAAFQPWLITYNLVTAEMTPGTPPGVRPHKLVTGVNPFQSGAITMTPSFPEKGDQVEFRADAGTGYSFAYWKSWGVSLDDPSSMVTMGTINNDISTVRAYFVKSSSDTVSSADISIPATGPGSVTIQGKIPESLTLPIAMNVKYPIKVSVGSEEFSFGPGVGERKVVLPQKLLFTTPDTKKGNSTLTLDYTTKTWTFSSPKAYDLGRAVLGTSSVRLGVSGRETGPVEDLPLVGTETCTWAGGIGADDNSVFSFGPQTLVKGNFTFNGAHQGLGTLEIRNAGLSHGTIDASTPVTFTVNQVKVHWDNATSTENGTYTYTKSERDLFTRLVLDTRSMTWQAEMSGKRLVHTTWPGAMTLTLQVGSDSGRTTIHPSVTADLHIWKKGPLKANFMAMPTRGTAPLPVQFTDLSGGQPTAWEWKFGDGTTSVRQDPEHTYAKEGTYTVTLTVRGSTGSGTLERKNYIVVSPRPVPLVADFMVSPVSGTAPLTVKCSDMSTGSPTMSVYSFGDGTSSTDRNPGHTYRVPGVYNITLIITKPDKSTGAILSNSSTKKGITVGAVPFEMPVAQFSASPTHGTTPLSVTFNDHSTGNPTMYIYSFGDGTNSSTKNPVHIYRRPGVYNVTLTVMKNDIANVTMVANASVPLELTVTK